MYLLNLGLVPYDDALALQHQIVAARKAGESGDVLILLEHPPVITLGRQADASNIVVGRELLDQLGVHVRHIERGGDVTYHGPGQLVAYPILDLRHHRKDVRWYVRNLQNVLVATLSDFDIHAEGRMGSETGVWVGDDKIAAIGVRIERWITYHGFALNVDPLMKHFDLIVPCGLKDKGVTAMRQVLHAAVDISAVRWTVAKHFAAVFGVDLQQVTLAELRLPPSTEAILLPPC